MWIVNNKDLRMAEGDFGIALPITVNGVEFTANDKLKFIFKTKVNGETILEKEYTPTEDNTVQLMFTEAEAALLPVGNYVYCLDWYQNDSFLCNVIPFASFKVVDKA